MENNDISLRKVEIDCPSIFNLELTPDLYLLLYYKYNNIPFNTLPQSFIYTVGTQRNLSYLEDKGFIKITNNPRFELRDKAIKLFSSDLLDNMFYELLSTYPMKVMGNSGAYRILRPKDPDASLNKEARKKYYKIIKGNRELHNRIIQSLNAELENKKQSNSLGYMQNFITWLNQRSWELYEGVEDESESSSETSLN